jgi:hypothetical protein
MTTHFDAHSGRNFGKDYDHNMRRARLAGYVLLAGLFLEVVSDIIWFHGVQSLVSIICVAIIAGGVSGEIFFENKARLANKDTPAIPAPPISRVQQPQPDYSWQRAA